MEMDGFILDLENNIENANTIKNIVLKKLYNDNVISEDIAEYYISNYGMVILSESWFKEIFKKTSEKGKWFYKMIKIIE